MTHLTVEEMIEFVSFDIISEETLDLSSKVNQHIRLCPECSEKVAAFQTVYDELCKIGNVSDAKQSIHRMVDEVSSDKVLQDPELSEYENLPEISEIKNIFR